MDADIPEDTHSHDAPVAPEAGAAAERAPGSVDPESSEPQIPRLGEGGASPGAHDPDRPTADAPAFAPEVSGGVPDAPVMGAPEVEAPVTDSTEAGAPTAADLAGTSDAAEAGVPPARSAGAGRAVEAAFQKRRQQQQQQQQARAGRFGEGQQQALQGSAGEGGRGTDDVSTDMDPEASHAIPERAPDEAVPEDAPVDVSIIGHGHEDKAAWNRARTANPQPGYDAVADGVVGAARQPGAPTPGSSEDMGYPGGAPSEGVPGLGTGDGRLDELADDAESDEDETLGDAADALDDETDGGTAEARGGRDRRPDLPEDRFAPDEGVAPEERLLDDENEDAMFASGELGEEDDLEMERLNEDDDIARDFEDQRSDMDDAASGNERSSGM